MPLHPIVRYPDPRLALAVQPVTVLDGALRERAGDFPTSVTAIIAALGKFRPIDFENLILDR